MTRTQGMNPVPQVGDNTGAHRPTPKIKLFVEGLSRGPGPCLLSVVLGRRRDPYMKIPREHYRIGL
jgi:hypothetical protein